MNIVCYEIVLEVFKQLFFSLRSLGVRVSQIMEPKRPLRPTRKERKKIGGQVDILLHAIVVLSND